MIVLSANVTAALASDSTQAFQMVRIFDAANPTVMLLNTTDNYADVTLDDGSIYLSDGKLLAVDMPQLNTVVDREQYKASIADNTFAYGPQMENGLVGKILESRLGFVNLSTGKPFTALIDTLLVYRGRVDGVGYSVDTKELGSVSLPITCASPMINLDRKKSVFLNKDRIRKAHPKDACCDQIFEGSGGVVIRWGKT